MTTSNSSKSNSDNDITTVYLNAFFHFDPQINRTQDLIFNSKAILTNEQFWESVQEGLFSVFKSGAAVILYQMGLRYGFDVGSKGREAKQTVHEAVEFLKTYGMLAGWGKFTTSPIILSDGQLARYVKVTVEDNFFAISQHKKSEEPRCFLISGLLAGITEGLLGEGYNCMETMCMATGAKHCEFLITRRR